MIAEDEALIRLDLAEMLGEEGYDVVGQAGDGEQAIALAEEHRPDLVVLDVKMPRLDGFWAEELQAPRQLQAQSRVIDGVPYRAYLIQKRALFPLRAGEIAIDPVELDIVTGRSIFRGGRRQHRKSLGATLQVKELPPGAPKGFRRGNVGTWSIRR